MGVLTVGLIDETLEKKEERERRALEEFIDWFYKIFYFFTSS